VKAPAANLVLIGLRGSGKTTLGRRVATLLGHSFKDLDDETALLLGAKTAGEALERHGEKAFRDAEALLLPGALARTNTVCALGGGTPTAPGAERLLEQARDGGQTAIIYLRANPVILRERLVATDISSRPSLTGAGTLEEIDSVFHARDALYRRLATHTVEVGAGSAEELAVKIAGFVSA